METSNTAYASEDSISPILNVFQVINSAVTRPGAVQIQLNITKLVLEDRDSDLNFDGTDKWCYVNITHNSVFAVSHTSALKIKKKTVTNTGEASGTNENQTVTAITPSAPAVVPAAPAEIVDIPAEAKGNKEKDHREVEEGQQEESEKDRRHPDSSSSRPGVQEYRKDSNGWKEKNF